MSDLIIRPLEPMLNVATQVICNAVWPGGFDVGPHAPDTYEALCAEYAARKRITVWEGACDGTIFDDPQINQMFRAWHDWCHIMGGHDFSVEGERQAALMQCQHIARRYGNGETGKRLQSLVMMEVLGQALYADAHGGAFPSDQMQFAKAYLALGPATAIHGTF